MGCVADKPIPENKGNFTPRSTPPPYPFNPPDNIIKAKLAEAIKKRDLILFQKVLQEYQIKPSQLIGAVEQAKTILHKLAEHNFSEGMSFLIEELTSQKSTQITNILNMKDNDGNTPLLLCCLYNAVETLEVLARNELVDIDAKNFAKKTALEIAMEMESPCVNVLTSLPNTSATTTKATIKSNNGDDLQQIRSLEEAYKGIQIEREDDNNSDSQNTSTSLDGKSPTLFRNEAKEGRNNQAYNGRLQQIIAELKVKDLNFEDCEFPHEIYYLEDEEDEGSLLMRFPQLTWIRPTQSLGVLLKPAAIYDDFLTNNVSKTPLAGCEIYSALAAMTEFPQRLARVFNIKEINKYGLYSVTFNVSGLPVEMLLDDYFPAIDETTLLYSQPAGNELWFSLLEKAFAKLHGGYNTLDSVGIVDALETLTGMPVAQKSLKEIDVDKLWAKLLDYDKRNFIITAGEVRKHHTLFKNRHFSLVSVIEAKDYKLVKLRNNFGDYSWEGDFSHNSPLWTKELREEVDFCKEDQTCFYMQLKDFVREFDFLTVCYYQDNWNQNRINTVSEHNHPCFFELTVEKETEAYISVHQKLPKFVDEGPEYAISPVELILAKSLDPDVMESIAHAERDAFLGKSSVYLHENHRIKLEQGKYIIYIKVKWVDANPHDFVLKVLSSVATQITKINPQDCKNFLEKVYSGAGIVSKDKFNLANDCQFASGWSGSHLWMFANNCTNKIWHLEVTFEKMTNLKLGKKFRTTSNVIKLVIPPYQRVSAYAKRIGPGAVNVAWKFNQRLE